MRFSQPLKINIVNMTCVYNRHVTFANISKHHATIQVKYMYYMTLFTKEYVYFFQIRFLYDFPMYFCYIRDGSLLLQIKAANK